MEFMRNLFGGKTKKSASETLIASITPQWIPGSLRVSPDNRRVAYLAQTGNKKMVVVNDKAGKPYDLIGHFAFSPDSQRFAYAAVTGNQGYVVVDGIESQPYHDIGALIFSPDS